MKQKNLIKSSFLLVVIFFIFSYIISGKGDMENDKSMNNKSASNHTTIIGKYHDRRETKMSTTEKYITDINKLSYKSDDKGVFEGTYTLIHNTQKNEKIVFYALLENSEKPLEFIINNEKKVYHIIDIPKNREEKINFKFNNLPSGKHIIYFFTEKYFGEYKITKPIDKTDFKNYISRYYFSVDVKSQYSIFSTKDSYKQTIKVEDIVEKGEKLSLFEDKKLSKKTDNVKKGVSYLLINNPYDFDIKGSLGAMVDYEYKSIEDIVVPKKSKSIISIDLGNGFIQKNESIKFLFLGIPQNLTNEDNLPIRIMIPSQRFQIEESNSL